MDRIPDKIDSKFRFVLVAANRAEQLMQGARPKLDPNGRKLTHVALQEVREDLIPWQLVTPIDPDAEIEAEAAPEEEAVAEEETAAEDG